MDSKSVLRLQHLHLQILCRDEEAFSELTWRVRPVLRRALRREFRRVDADSIDGAIDDALMDYWSNPSGYDALRNARLGGYVLVLARRNLLNTLVSDRRRRTREGRYAEETIRTNVIPPVWPMVGNRQTVESLCRGFLGSIALADRRAAGLWLAGERRTSVLGTALGLDTDSPDELRRGVKRFKDRMTKQLQAAINRLGTKIAQTKPG